MRRQRLSVGNWDRSRICSERICPVRSPPIRLFEKEFGVWQRIYFREFHFYYSIQVRLFCVVCYIHLPNFFEKTLLSDCPKVTMLGLHGQFSFVELWFMVIGNKI